MFVCMSMYPQIIRHIVKAKMVYFLTKNKNQIFLPLLMNRTYIYIRNVNLKGFFFQKWKNNQFHNVNFITKSTQIIK